MLFAIVSTSSALDGPRGTTHSTTMDLISEIQLGPRSGFGLYQDPVSKAALLDPNLDSNGPLDQIRQQVDLGFATLSCRNRDHQGKFNFLLALSKSVLYPVEDWVCDDHQRHKLFCLDFVEGFHGLFLRFDDPCVFDPAESEVNTRLFVSHDSYLAHVCFLLEDPACLLGPEQQVKLCHRYAYVGREPSQLLFNLQVPLLGDRRGYFRHDFEPSQVPQDVSVENRELFTQPDVPKEMAGFFVAESPDILDQPFAKLEGIVEALDAGFQLKSTIRCEEIPGLYDVAGFAVSEPDIA